MLKKDKKDIEKHEYLDYYIRLEREKHPTMGVRDLYFKINPFFMGRDKFERFCKENGYYIRKQKVFRRTTDSSGVIRFENKIKGLEITGINQVWQSDITYVFVGNRYYFITFIIDAYSRVIVGYNVSNYLTAEDTTIAALRKAIKFRGGKIPENLIFHSDGGGQYFDKIFLKLTKKYHIINSMCKHPWENGIAERLNGIVKNNYLKHRSIRNFGELIKEVDRTVYLHNYEKPHIKLKRLTPIMFEKSIHLQKQEKTRKTG
jgi:transposase InsO family protein